jgi:integrase
VLHPRSGKGRALDNVRRRWAKRKGPYIFHRNGKRIGAFQGAWKKACEAAGLEGVLFHDLKRSAARNMRRTRNASEHVIMKAAGWRTPSMFRRYNIVDDADVAALFARTSRRSSPSARRSRRSPARGRSGSQAPAGEVA